MLRSVFRTRAGARASLVQVVCGVAVLSTIGVIALADEPNDLFCWSIPSGTCDYEGGDCAFRMLDDDCWHCLGHNEISAACIWRPSYNCVGEGEVELRARRKGKCQADGTCSGAIPAGWCTLWPCTVTP